VQSKALTALLLALAALTLWGCGGGDDHSATTAVAGASAGDQQQSPVGNLAAARRRAEEEQQRLEKEAETAPAVGKPDSGGGDREGDARGGSLRPLKHHHDSGGGAAQFEVAGGDSVQAYGTEADSGQRREAAAVLHAFLDAEAARDWAAACAYISVGAVAALEQIPKFADQPEVSGCPEILGALSAEAPQGPLVEGAAADVGALRIEDDRGFILLHGPRGDDFVMPMVREDGRWKVGTLEPIPLGA